MAPNGTPGARRSVPETGVLGAGAGSVLRDSPRQPGQPASHHQGNSGSSSGYALTRFFSSSPAGHLVILTSWDWGVGTSMDTTLYGWIYIITNTVNGRQYVGQTVQGVGVRWRGHVRGAAKSSQIIGMAIVKYGHGAFTIQEIDTATSQADLDAKEIHWIAKHGTMAPNGYNLTGGGVGGGRHTPETRAKIGAASRGRKKSPETMVKVAAAWTPEKRAAQAAARIGKQQSPEAKAKTLTANTGMRRTPEAKARMSAAQTGRTHSPETRARISEVQVGRKHSPETKAKMSEAHRGCLVSPEHRAKLSAALLGRTYSPETLAKMSASAKRRGVPRP